MLYCKRQGGTILFDRLRLTRLKPLLIFFAGYTVLFYFFAVTLKYTFPFLAGFLLALAVQPLIRVLKKRMRFCSGAAAAVATLVAFILLFGLLFLLGYWLIYEINNLLVYLAGISNGGFKEWTGPIKLLLKQTGEYIGKIDGNFIKQNKDQLLGLVQNSAGIATTVLSSMLKFLTSLPAVFTMFIVMIFSTYFFSKDMDAIKRRIASMIPDRIRKGLKAASHHGINMSGKYVCSYLLIYFITFLETLIVFSALGVPFPLVISIITGIADVLPVLGPGTIYIPLAFIYLCVGDFFRAGTLLACWLLITAIRQVIEPKLVSSSINIHPLTMLAAIYFALIANNFWLLIYISALAMLYELLTMVDLLPRIFEPDSPTDDLGKKTKP